MCLNYTQGDDDDDRPVLPGMTVTKNQSLLLILSYMLRHKLTDAALCDLLLLLNTFFPGVAPTSKYLFYKAFNMEDFEVRNTRMVPLACKIV